jgi:glucose/arabinose dehydrogenase
VEQPGRVRIIQNGQVLRGAYLDIRERVGSRGNEQGLLGLAFHPRFSENGFLYVNYTDQQGDTIIARFSADPAEYRADPASEFQLLRIPQPYPNHNGGQVSFGPDGYLYLGLGDGGSAGDPQDNAQSLETLLGKILRIDVTGGTPYAIPTDNPFANGGGRPEIWAYGLRNPWRFSFDRLTGDLYIADVGQNAWEEINVMPADSPGGANFGWDYFEAVFPFEGSPPDQLRQLEPVSYYAHSEGCSVTVGVVYRGLNLPAWQGVYLYGDFCSGTIWGLLQTPGGWLNAPLFRNVGNLTTFGEDEAGEVFVADRSGAILQLVSK